MAQIEPVSSWRIRIISVNEHHWEYEENGEWKVFHSPSGEAIELRQESAGYIFYDEAWKAEYGAGPTVPDLSISGPVENDPFGGGPQPSFAPAAAEVDGGVQAFRWPIVGRGSAYQGGFPHSTDGRPWSFSAISGDVKVDPEMVILRPDPPPER